MPSESLVNPWCHVKIVIHPPSLLPLSYRVRVAPASGSWCACGSPPERSAVVALRVQSKGIRQPYKHAQRLCASLSQPQARYAIRPNHAAHRAATRALWLPPFDCKPPGI